MSQQPKKEFVFRKHMSIGEADAENDKQFLEDCFVDNGDYAVLEDTETPQSIVLGRTGVGKSALLERLEESNEQVIRIEPDELALKHVSNSTVLKFFEEIGVNLDIFYNLLWQHTLAVELIKNKYNIDSNQAKSNFLDTLSAVISGNQKKQQALKYIEEWGDKFWIDTETRIREFTEKLESNLKASVASGLPGIKLTADAAKKLTEEQKSEVIHYGKQVVNSVQIEKLSKIINLLSEDIFTDPQNRTYILIDRLDENWVEDELRYKLIRALIETIKKFRNIKPVKIIMTLRTDLLDRVLEKTRDSGFQKEKYTSLFLEIRWTKDQLKELLDSRINHLLKYKYTRSDVFFDDIFPQKIDKVSASEYIIERTLLRPRDAIIFVNECLIEAEGRTEISASTIKKAEQVYSHNRFESLQYEWFVEHPRLSNYIEVLSKKRSNFRAKAITEENLEELILKASYDSEQTENTKDIVMESIDKYLECKNDDSQKVLTELRQNLLFVLYKIGIVGIKLDGTSTTSWIMNRTQNLRANKIDITSIVYIHKILWRELAVDQR